MIETNVIQINENVRLVFSKWFVFVRTYDMIDKNSSTSWGNQTYQKEGIFWNAPEC